MGAHTLGNAATDASGYRGAWIGGQTTDFNNVYYQFLTGAGVVFENAVRQIRTHIPDNRFTVYTFIYPRNSGYRQKRL